MPWLLTCWLCCHGLTVASKFHDELLARSCVLLRADRGAVVEISDGVAGDGLGWPRQPTAPLRAVWGRRFGEHPTIAALRQSSADTYRLLEHRTLRDLHRLPIYCEFLRPMGCHDQVAMALHVRPNVFVAVALTRTDAEFTDNDRHMLTRLSGPLRHLYAAARVKDRQARVLTGRESTILRLIADGHTDGSIARQLGISQRTVGKHLESVRLKLGANSRARAVATWLGSE